MLNLTNYVWIQMSEIGYLPKALWWLVPILATDGNEGLLSKWPISSADCTKRVQVVVFNQQSQVLQNPITHH